MVSPQGVCLYWANSGRNPIFEAKTLMGTHLLKEVEGATFHESSRSQWPITTKLGFLERFYP